MFVNNVHLKRNYNGLTYCKLKKLKNQILTLLFTRNEGTKGLCKEFGIEVHKNETAEE
jgi:hypothetical protein